MDPLKIESWEVEKDLLIRIFAQWAARSAHLIYEVLPGFNQKEFLNKFEECPLDEWLHYYRRPRDFFGFMISGGLKFGGTVGMLAGNFYYLFQSHPAFRLKVQLKPPPPTSFTIEELQSIHTQFIREDIENQPLADEVKQTVTEVFLTKEFLFLIQIILRSWLLYGESPIQIYKKATHGEHEALERLLRLDKLQIQNPRINRWLYRLARDEKDQYQLAALLTTFRDPTHPKITLRKVKYLMAGLISVGSELLGERLSAPEIQNLFDAVNMDLGIDTLRDHDLPSAPESFAKAIQREREFWITALFLDRTKLFSEVSGSL